MQDAMRYRRPELFVYDETMRTAAAKFLLTDAPDRGQPVSAGVFGSFVAAFFLTLLATYPEELFLYALVTSPLLALPFGILGYGVWMGSKVVWVINLVFFAGVIWQSLTWALGTQNNFPAHNFNVIILWLMMAAVLLNLLLCPSMVRWIWRRHR